MACSILLIWFDKAIVFPNIFAFRCDGGCCCCGVAMWSKMALSSEIER